MTSTMSDAVSALMMSIMFSIGAILLAYFRLFDDATGDPAAIQSVCMDYVLTYANADSKPFELTNITRTYDCCISADATALVECYEPKHVNIGGLAGVLISCFVAMFYFWLFCLEYRKK